MLKITGYLLGISLAIFAMGAYAGDQGGYVSQLIVRASDGLVFVYLNGGPISNRAVCSANTTYWIIKDETSNAGKQQFAQLMAAKAGNIPVHIYGAGTCTRWGDGEDINYIALGSS